MDSQTGAILWEVSSSSNIVTQAKVSPDDLRVYAVEVGVEVSLACFFLSLTPLVLQSMDGTVLALNQTTGDVLFAVNCSQLDPNCTPQPVEGEFELSPSGLVLYFGDIRGNVQAWQLGSTQFPTPSPTEFPPINPSYIPTTEPSLAPSYNPSPGQSSVPSPSNSPSLAFSSSQTVGATGQSACPPRIGKLPIVFVSLAVIVASTMV